jgi:ABC-type branched-subunit amino acid transport system substrate-binding protein
MRRRLIATACALALFGAACSKSHPSASKNAPKANEVEPAVALATTAPPGLKVGMIISNAGPGKDVTELASGAYVAEYRLNAAKAGSVQLVVEDDTGTADGAVAAVDKLADDGVAGVVYGSTGDQAKAAAGEAATRGVAFIAPYDGTAGDAADTTFLTGPTDAQAAAELAAYVKDKALAPVAVVHQVGGYGDAGRAALSGAGLAVQSDVSFDPAAADPGAAARTVAAAKPGVVVAWTELDGGVRLMSDLKAAGVTAPVLFAPRTAVPGFGRAEKGLAAPAATDGLLSAGTWAGPWTPTAAVDAFYLAREKAAAAGARADLTNADFRAHDAVLAIVAAAAIAKSGDAASLLPALRRVNRVTGAAGVPAHFDSATGVADGDVALLSYSTIDDGRGRLPDPATGGGAWVAVAGTYQPPADLRGLDDPFGG